MQSPVEVTQVSMVHALLSLQSTTGLSITHCPEDSAQTYTPLHLLPSSQVMGVDTHKDLRSLFRSGLVGSHVSMVHFNCEIKSAGKEDKDFRIHYRTETK